MPFSTYDDLINEITTNGKLQEFGGYKYGPTAEAAGVWTRLWASNGLPGAPTEQAVLITVSAGANNGGLIQLTITSNTVYATGDTVVISNITGTGAFAANSNGAWTITRDSATLITLQGSTFSGTYTSGGVVYKTNAYSSASGSMNFANVSTDTRHLLTFGATSTQDGVLMLYDRLTSVEGINLATTGDKTITTPTLPRYSGTAAAGVEPWLEFSVAGITTTPIVTLKDYTDDSGNLQTGFATSVALSTSPVQNAMFALPIDPADKGVRVATTLNVGTASTSGIGTVSLIRPIAYLPLQSNQWNEQDYVLQLSSLPRLYDGVSLGLAFLAAVTTAANFNFHVRCGYG